MQTIQTVATELSAKLQNSTNNECSKSLTRNLESKYTPAAIQAATAKVLNLFSELKEEYGDLFEYKKHRYTTAKAREWAVELLESGINGAQYENGRWQAIKKQKYPIERAFEFIELCKQGVANEYPTALDAFNTACSNCGMKGDVKRNWKHEVVYEAANRIGFGVLASASEGYFKSFKLVYDQVVFEHKNGAQFALPKERQLSYSHTPVQPNSPFNAKIDAFFEQFGSKGKAVAQ